LSAESTQIGTVLTSMLYVNNDSGDVDIIYSVMITAKGSDTVSILVLAHSCRAGLRRHRPMYCQSGGRFWDEDRGVWEKTPNGKRY